MVGEDHLSIFLQNTVTLREDVREGFNKELLIRLC